MKHRSYLLVLFLLVGSVSLLIQSNETIVFHHMKATFGASYQSSRLFSRYSFTVAVTSVIRFVNSTDGCTTNGVNLTDHVALIVRVRSNAACSVVQQVYNVWKEILFTHQVNQLKATGVVVMTYHQGS